MELTVNKDDLAKALNNVEGIASAKTSMPILENILLQTDGPRLLIAATNLEIAISQKISAKIEKVGSIMVPASLTKSFISSLQSNSQVSFKVSGDHILLKVEIINLKLMVFRLKISLNCQQLMNRLHDFL